MLLFSVSGFLNLIPEVFSTLVKGPSQGKKTHRLRKSASQKLVYANSDSRIFNREPVTTS